MRRDNRGNDEPKEKKIPEWMFWTAIGTTISILVIVMLMWGLPKYKIYRLDLKGQAALAEAAWTKKVAIEDAKAAYDSSEWYKKKSIRDAEAVAESNKIIGDSLKGNDAYLRFLWIQNVGKDSDGERIYIATEAGLPILEAKSGDIND